MGAFQTIIYEKKQGVALITLNRPQQLNAVNTRMRDELYEALPAIDDDPEVLVGVIRGAGEKAFSAGADISEFGTVPSQAIARQVRWERDLWGMFLRIRKPLIAAVHGFALGAGVEMAMCCDLRIASEDAKFGLPEVNLGMIPTAGGSQTMPRLVLLGRVSEIILTGDRLDARRAWEIGLVNRVVPRSELYPAAEALARNLMTLDQQAARLAKEAVTRGLDMQLGQGLELERRLCARLMSRATPRNG